MNPPSDHDEQRRRMAALFDAVAAGYDAAPLRLFPFIADRLIAGLKSAPGEKLLDVAAGTGAVALAAAQALAPGGRVTAIDISEGMLARLNDKVLKFGTPNLDVHVMDGRQLEFRRNYFPQVVCSFGLSFMPDSANVLKEWVRATRPGGQVMFTVPAAGAFEPMCSQLTARLAGDGLKTISESECQQLSAEVGLIEVTTHTESLGYHVKNTAEWWELAWFSGLFPGLHALAPAEQEQTHREHLAEVERHVTGDGLRIDARYLVATGRKPG
jgi:ubiquinone/menaquinone biosynthesis C-methylase UbiE